MHKVASFRSARRPSSAAQSPSNNDLRRPTLFGSGQLLRSPSKDLDRLSETSSQEERRFATLLGADDDSQHDMGVVEVENLGHRLYIIGVEKQRAREEVLRKKREKIILSELNQMTTKPNITHHARCQLSKGSMFADHSLQWLEERDARLQDTASRVQSERDAELTLTPQINKHSQEIAEINQYRGPIKGWQDHFAKYYAKKTSASMHGPTPDMFTPNVNHSYRHKNPSPSDPDASSRLFEESFTRGDRMRERVENAREDELKDPYTGRAYFTPIRIEHPLPQGREGLTPEEATDHLHSLWAQQQNKIKEKQQYNVDDESTFHPTINTKSTRIGDNRRKPLYHKKEDYSASPLPNRRSAKADTSAVERSKRASPASVGDFLRRTENNSTLRQSRLERIRNEANEHETRECTFKPAVNRRSMELFFKGHRYGTDMADHTVNRYQNESAPINETSRSGFAQNSTPSPTPRGAPQTSRHSPAAAFRDPNASSIQRGDSAEKPDDMRGSISNFERQMFEVLDEWRRLEDV